MKLQFLGTSAGECYPALWCNCAYCTYARVHGGRNIRLNSCAVLDEDVLIDMGATCFSAALQYGVDITKISHLFITHDHQDHFFPQHLVWRSEPYHLGQTTDLKEPVTDIELYRDAMGPRFSPIPFLHIYGHHTVLEAISAHPRLDVSTMAEKQRMDFLDLSAGQTITAGNLTVTAVKSNHSKPGTVYNYIFQRNGKTLLYALDCGGYTEEMQALLRGFRYDCVVMEGTFGKHAVDFDFHMNQRKNLDMLAFFNDNGLWADTPNMWLSHMAPHWTPPYDEYAKEMGNYGIGVAYDGMVLYV
jgi:phosphoribosyl 1,2-cyclic phosphate phosphodiesterase